MSFSRSRATTLALTLRRRSLSTGDLAKAICYTPGLVSRVAHGHLKPTRIFRALASQELDIPEGVLFPADEMSVWEKP